MIKFVYKIMDSFYLYCVEVCLFMRLRFEYVVFLLSLNIVMMFLKELFIFWKL